MVHPALATWDYPPAPYPSCLLIEKRHDLLFLEAVREGSGAILH